MYRHANPPRGTCPRCHRLLEIVDESDVAYQKCGCGGVFVDVANFQRMWRLMSSPEADLPTVPALRPRPAIYALPCPSCRRGMLRVDVLGIPVDQCHDDGLWFDPPELETALMAAALPFHEWLRRFAARLLFMK
jgi:Zn-finger nucleic acid-binding protein